MTAEPPGPSPSPHRRIWIATIVLCMASLCTAGLALAALALEPAGSGPVAWIAATAGTAAGAAAVWAAWLARPRDPSIEPNAPAPVPPAPDPGFRAALEGLADPILIVSGGEPDDHASRRILYANAAARRLLKVREAGSPLIAGLRDPEALEAIDETLFGRIAREVAYEPAGAQDRHWRLASTPLEGETARAVVRLRDETESRRMDRMRADFIANASHELKTPLASLQGFIETLKGHARDDDRARDRFLDIMSAQTARMNRMIHDLLSLSRIELREHIPPSGSADVTLAAGDVVDALEPLLRDHDARIDLSAVDGPAVVAGERDQLIQVIQNLSENAVRYSPRGSTITVCVQGDLGLAGAQAPAWPGAARLAILTPDRDETARYVLIRVADRGRGLARETLPRLTERFYRVEGQKSGESPGTGLGLSIVKHIVNRHRGGLVVESVEGEGTVFSVYLPAAGRHGTVAEPS